MPENSQRSRLHATPTPVIGSPLHNSPGNAHLGGLALGETQRTPDGQLNLCNLCAPKISCIKMSLTSMALAGITRRALILPLLKAVRVYPYGIPVVFFSSRKS